MSNIIQQRTTKIINDNMIVYGAGMFQETFLSLNKAQAALLLIDIYKFLDIKDEHKTSKSYTS